jgi:glycosyltransferase involved in cell wall biosynthesis
MSGPAARMPSVLAYPRDANPYQASLYGAMISQGARVRYVGELTPSASLSLLLLPLELLWCGLRGWDVWHVHWLFKFSPPGSARLPVLRRVAHAWLQVVLGVAKRLPLRVVWTVHNVLPHEPIFDDDAAARRALVDACHLVIVHSEPALEELAQIGARPARTAMIPQGPPHPEIDAGALRPPRSTPEPVTFLFVGKILAYKGVEELLDAAGHLSPDVPAHIVVAGACQDPTLRRRLQTHAEAVPDRVDLRMNWVGDDELSPLIERADVVVLPFREVTNSSSVLLAMSHGRPVLVPDMPTFQTIPDAAILRYDGTTAGLAERITAVCEMPADDLRRLGTAAAAHANAWTWDDAAARTLDALAGCAE